MISAYRSGLGGGTGRDSGWLGGEWKLQPGLIADDYSYGAG